MKIYKFSLVLLLLITISGCSRVQFAYNQLDWLIPYYVSGYVEMTENQGYYLDEQVTVLLNWHCSEHLASYARLLRDANQQFQSGNVTAAQLQAHVAQFEAFWREIIQHASPSLVELFHSFSDEQVDDLRQRFLVDNREWYEDFREKSIEEIQQSNLDFMQHQLERWFGDLSQQQLDKVKEWSKAFKTLGQEGQRAREHWQQKLIHMLDSRQDLNQLTTGVELLFVDPVKLRAKDYIKRIGSNKKVTIQLISNLSGSLSQEQLGYMDNMITSISGDFDILACKPARLATSQGEQNL